MSTLNLIRSLVLAMCVMALPARADQVRDIVVAAQTDNASYLRRLIARGASPNTVDPTTGHTILMVALREDAQQVVAELLKHPQIDLERKAPNGNRALMLASFKRNRPAVLALIARGAVVTYPGWTPLHYAAASGDTDIAAILLEHSAYIDAEAPARLTPLMIAAREGKGDVAALLLREGADATLRSSEGLDARQIALRAGHPAIAAIISAHLAAQPPGR